MSTWARDTVALVFALLVFVVAIVVTVRLVPPAKPSGRPQTCGTAGVYKVVPRSDVNDLTVICENGRTYYP